MARSWMGQAGVCDALSKDGLHLTIVQKAVLWPPCASEVFLHPAGQIP
jgi:hypothetical protein